MSEDKSTNMSVPSSKCRICLEEKRKGELVPVSTPWQEEATRSIKDIIKFCVPAVSIQDDSKICSTCMRQLESAYCFIKRCLITESILLPDTVKLDKLVEKTGDCEDTIENEEIIKNEDKATDEIELSDHSYFITLKDDEEDLQFDNERLNEAVEVVDNKSQNKPETSLGKKHKTSMAENATNSFPKGILEVLDFAATNVMCLSMGSDMTQENHDDLIQNGINIINMSSGSTKKKRVIYVGRELEYREQRCAMCDLTFATACDYADHAHLHHKGKIKLPDNVGFKCNQCDSEFLTNMALKEHYKIAHNSSKPYSCKKCTKRFSNFKDLQNHTEIFEDQEKCVLKCQKCNRMFKRVVEFQRHKEIFKGKEKCTVSCQRCDKEFSTLASLRAHEADVADTPSCDYVKCIVCLQKFSKEDYKTHLLDHSPQFLCPQCGKGFYTSTSLGTHQKNVHQKGYNTICHECGKVVRMKSLRQHIRIFHNVGTFMCDKCPKQFKNAHYLRKHRLQHGVRQKSYTCEKCGKSVYTKSALKDHIALLHLGEAKHVCPMCGEGFLRLDYLKRHIKFHEKYMQFSCKVCKMSFSSNGKLLTHETHGHDENGKPLHIGRKPVPAHKRKSRQYSRERFLKYCKPCVCSICNKVVANSKYLTIHYRSHLKIKDFKCEKCDILFQSWPSLKRHMERHKNPNFDLGCNICHVYCNSKSELAKHIARTHKSLKYCCRYCPSKFGRKYLLYSHENMKHKEEISKKKEVLNILTKQECNYNVPENYVRPRSLKGRKFDYLETDVDELMQKVAINLPTVSQDIPECDFNIFGEEDVIEEIVDELDKEQIEDEDFEFLSFTEVEQGAHILSLQ